jgi:hypothetical protein
MSLHLSMNVLLYALPNIIYLTFYSIFLQELIKKNIYYQLILNIFRKIQVFNDFESMKLYVKYHNQWGKFTTMAINVSSQSRVEELKKVL